MKLIDDLKSDRIPVIAAPLAGYHDPPQVSILVNLGVEHLIYPFISSEGMVKRKIYRDQVMGKLSKWKKAVPKNSVHLQIFGRDPETMAEAAIFLESEVNCDCIDLNMGCSVRKIWKSQSGSFLLQKPEIAIKIVDAVVSAVNIPVTLKTRSGWDKDENGLDLIREAARIGVAAVALHPRKGKSQWKGDAEWGDIAKMVTEINIPVIGNGDIKTPEDALEMVNRTGCAGVMIGRASIGDPWIFARCSSFLTDGVHLMEPTWEVRIDTCISHIEKLVGFRGEKIGVRESRKHVGRYLKGLPGASATRKELVLIDDFSDVKQALLSYRERLLSMGPEKNNVN